MSIVVMRRHCVDSGHGCTCITVSCSCTHEDAFSRYVGALSGAELSVAEIDLRVLETGEALWMAPLGLLQTLSRIPPPPPEIWLLSEVRKSATIISDCIEAFFAVEVQRTCTEMSECAYLCMCAFGLNKGRQWRAQQRCREHTSHNCRAAFRVPGADKAAPHHRARRPLLGARVLWYIVTVTLFLA